MVVLNKPSRVMLSLDVEADGPSCSTGSMVSLALVDVANPTKHFYSTCRPVHDLFNPNNLAACGFTREQTLTFPPLDKVMQACDQWLASNYPNASLIVFSDNPGFDWQFFNDAFHRTLGRNPCGHSSRRIGDVWAGWTKNIANTSSWKKMRTTKHTHNALDDAKGNAGALVAIMAKMQRRP